MTTYLLELSYSGIGYSGFQIQKNAKTVAGELTRASNKLFGCECKIQGCSRTDAGVHAKQFYCSVHVQSCGNGVPVEKIPQAMNCLLPYDISVKRAQRVAEGYNPRFETLYKTYEYVIRNSAVKDPFSYRLKLPYKYPLDEKMLDLQAKDYIGTHDFAAFMASGADVASTVRTVYDAAVTRIGDDVIYTVTADGFLYNMVRIMVGTLLCISEGKLIQGCIPDLIEKKDRTRAGITVPADGLYLAKVALR